MVFSPFVVVPGSGAAAIRFCLLRIIRQHPEDCHAHLSSPFENDPAGLADHFFGLLPHLVYFLFQLAHGTGGLNLGNTAEADPTHDQSEAQNRPGKREASWKHGNFSGNHLVGRFY
jgi:hypothetical protein